MYSKSVLTKNRGETLNTLDYLFRFLEAYDFSAEGSEEIREERKSLINASVLGLIFDKINGYKDGSFYTPGFITEYMARETLRKSVTDAFNKKYEWSCESLDDVEAEIHRDRIPYKDANAVINDLKICDPAVGSGHFLVSCLNELIAIKSKLRILCDADMKVLREVDVAVENDELIVSWKDEGLFQYDVTHTWQGRNKLKDRKVSPDKHRVQKALFHEKRYLIENCLFGVDINQNSVNICRLRLWIELLKRAYYKQESSFMELEVLPNIDINIKQGNSLVSRFELADDLSSVFKKSDHSLEDYKEAVRTYKHTGDRTEKARLQQLIDDIKNEYSTTLTNLSPINQKLSKARGRLDIMQSNDLFGDVKFSQKDIIEKMTKKGVQLETYIGDEIKYGIKTGYNKAFVIVKETRDKLIAKDSNSKKIIKPFISGDDVRFYRVKELSNYLLFIPWHFPFHNDNSIVGASSKAEKEFKNQYPAVYKYLEGHKEKLKKRNQESYEWYALQRYGSTYHELFNKAKILYPEIAKESRFTIDSSGLFINKTIFMIPTDDKYLLGVLNSKLVWLYLKRICSSLGDPDAGGRLNLQRIYVSKVPIVDAKKNIKEKVSQLVNRILLSKKENPEADTTDLESEIDQLVYELYELSEEEIGVVEGSY